MEIAISKYLLFCVALAPFGCSSDDTEPEPQPNLAADAGIDAETGGTSGPKLANEGEECGIDDDGLIVACQDDNGVLGAGPGVIGNGEVFCHPEYDKCVTQVQTYEFCCRCMFDNCGSGTAYNGKISQCAAKVIHDETILYDRSKCIPEEIGLTTCEESCYMFKQEP